MNNNLNNSWYHEIEVKNWVDLQNCFNKNFKNDGRKWLFRGQKSARWTLKTSLERIIEMREDFDIRKSRQIESWLIRWFQRQSKRYIINPPKDEDFLEWCSIIQHHGGPTRLLDWTYSFYIAAYFAIHDVNPTTETQCAIWAIDWEWWRENSLNELDPELRKSYEKGAGEKKPERFSKLIEAESPAILDVSPFYMIDRLTLQQGLFIMSTNISCTLMDNMKKIQSKNSNRKSLIKIKVPLSKNFVKESLSDLEIINNITWNTLFPGLDGFAHSLIDLGLLNDYDERDR